MRQLPLEFGKVTRDHRHVEASENRLLWLAVEQETEGRLKTALGRMLAGRQPLAHFTRHRDVVTSHALSFTNDHFEIERDALANAPDLDHGDLSVVEPPETGGTVVSPPVLMAAPCILVKGDFDAFLEAGILAHGFLRLRRTECAHKKLVAFFLSPHTPARFVLPP